MQSFLQKQSSLIIYKSHLETGLDTAEAVVALSQITTWRAPVTISKIINWENTVNYPVSNWSIIASKEMLGQGAPGPLKRFSNVSAQGVHTGHSPDTQPHHD